MTILHGAVYLSLAVFIVAIVARAVRIAKTPVHLRWELYPVPHEGGRAKHGGSRLEEVDWWTKTLKPDHMRELMVMIPEILLLKGVWDHNRPLWFGSWTLHFGLYLLIGFLGLEAIAALFMINGVAFDADIPLLIATLISMIAWAGAIIGAIGTIVMFSKRAFDKKFKMYNTGSHFFNIIHIGVINFSLIVWLVTDKSFIANHMSLFGSLFTLSAPPALGIAAWVHIIASLLFFIYLPFTHMTHFFTKYFTYHDVRWEDEPNKPGSKLEKKVVEAVSQPVTWAAPHIQADGKKNWVDLVGLTGSEPEKEEKN